jgi:hypothetical protein
MAYSKQFIADALERAVSTVAQTALAVLTADGANLLSVTTTGFLLTCGTAGVVSILKSIVASRVGDKDSASLLPSVEAK